MENNALVLIGGLLLYSIFHTFASYGFRYYKTTNRTFSYIFTVCLLSGIISYMIKIPLYYYYSGTNHMTIYLLYLTILSFSMSVYSVYFIGEKVKTHTYLILFAFIGLIALNDYLNKRY
jgi:hypothetical protein